jgi:hypothetical protein
MADNEVRPLTGADGVQVGVELLGVQAEAEGGAFEPQTGRCSLAGSDDIQAAFEPWFETTITEPTDPTCCTPSGRTRRRSATSTSRPRG